MSPKDLIQREPQWNVCPPSITIVCPVTKLDPGLDRKTTAISLLVVLGMRGDGQKVLLAINSMGGETTEAWRAVLDGLVARGLRRPEFLLVDGAPGLEKALTAIWGGVPTQRCTVHKPTTPT